MMNGIVFIRNWLHELLYYLNNNFEVAKFFLWGQVDIFPRYQVRIDGRESSGFSSGELDVGLSLCPVPHSDIRVISHNETAAHQEHSDCEKHHVITDVYVQFWVIGLKSIKLVVFLRKYKTIVKHIILLQVCLWYWYNSNLWPVMLFYLWGVCKIFNRFGGSDCGWINGSCGVTLLLWCWNIRSWLDLWDTGSSSHSTHEQWWKFWSILKNSVRRHFVEVNLKVQELKCKQYYIR